MMINSRITNYFIKRVCAKFLVQEHRIVGKPDDKLSLGEIEKEIQFCGCKFESTTISSGKTN